MQKEPIHLLIVEDEAGMVEMFRQHIALEKDPIEATYCGTFSEAQAAVEKRRPDISVLDLNLPDEHGVTTFRRFMQITDGLIVIVCSGFMDLGMKEHLIDLGAAAVIDKPFDMGNLIGLIRAKASKGLSKLENIIKQSKEATN